MELLFGFFIEIFGNWIIESIFYGVEEVFKQPKNKLLHKRFILLKTINPKIRKGLYGVVWRVINEKKLYVCFRNKYGKKIAYQNSVFFTVLKKNTNLVLVN